jgi:CHAT domain-containing protein/outer membrane protein assembly factor BamD (BamD/ComL family)
LTRPFDKHLDSDELDKLVSPEGTSAGSERLSEQALREAQRHVESCQDCSRKVQMHKSVQGEILRMRAFNPSAPTPECIGEAEWLEAAAGLYPDAKTRELMKHAAQCGRCGPLLKNAAETLADETTSSEETLLNSLSSARPEWQKNMAATLRDSVGTQRIDREKKGGALWWHALLSWPRPAVALAGIAVAVIAGWLGLRIFRSPSADQLLAQAYAEHRTLEVRIPGAKFAPMRVERAASGSSLDKSPSLLKAEALIGENLRKNPNDPAWLQAKARADLLDGNYESAIKSLQRALETQPDDPTLLTDLGSAYFVRAEAADRPVDYGNAIESISKALAKSPDDPVALYNRAMVCERMFLYTQAVDDWQQYVRVDPSGEWAEDARKHLAALEEKLKKHAERLAEPLLTPREIAAAGPEYMAIRKKIDDRIEDYLDVAVTEWLPKAYRAAAQSDIATSDVQNALQAVADVASEKHGDQWLVDVLTTLPALSPLAIQALSQSVQMNATAEYSSAERAARASESYLAATGEGPLLLRARLEQLIAVNRRFEGTNCRQTADMAEKSLRKRPYIWIRTQLLLERANCAGASGSTRSNREYALAALRLAETHTYLYVSLRAMGSVAGWDANPTRAFETNLDGLRLYWAGVTSPSRAYQFLAAMAILAEDRRRWKFATVLNREAVAAIAAAKRPAIEAAARSWLGRAAYQAGYADLAAQEWERSREMFRAIPADQAVRSALAQLAVDLAEVDLDNGNFSNASAELADAAPRLSESGLHQLSIEYYATLGRLHERLNQRDDAERAFNEAVLRTEREASSAKTVFERIRRYSICAVCYRSIVRLRLETGDTTGAQAAWEHYRNLGSGTGKIESSTSPAINLPPDTALYSLVDIGDRVVAWLTTTNGTEFRELGVSRSELQHTAERFAAACSDSASSIENIQLDGHKLYGWLLAPLAQQTRNAHFLIFDEDPALPLVPFEALVDDKGRYLAESHAVAYTIGTAFLERSLPTAAQLLAGKALMVASTTPAVGGSAGIAPLPEAIREARDVAARFPHSSILEGSEARISEIERKLDGVSVFHYAGHASATPGHTGLLLAADPEADDSQFSALMPERVAVSKLRNLDLVVLSACSTAQLPEDDSSDIAGLSQDFLLAGGKVVLGNKWAADSSASELQMLVFYDRLLAGGSAADALNQAQSQLRDRQNFAHPFFWCAPSVWL